jgi:hypothetical protein
MECVYCQSNDLERKISYTNINENFPVNIDLKKKEILNCNKCKLVFCSNVSVEELDEFYKMAQKKIENKNDTNSYNSENENWAPFNSRFFSQFMYYKQYAGLNNVDTVLEIGPNFQGILPTLKFFKKNIKYYFIDQASSPSMIKNGAIHLSNYFNPEKTNIPITDLVWMSHSLEHIHPKLFTKTINKIYETLSTGGYFFIEVPDNLKENIYNFPHTLFFYEDTLRNILEKSGFKIISSQSIEKAEKSEYQKQIKSENKKKKLTKNLFFQLIKNLIKKCLSNELKKKLLLFYAVRNLNGSYSDRPYIRIVAQK